MDTNLHLSYVMIRVGQIKEEATAQTSACREYDATPTAEERLKNIKRLCDCIDDYMNKVNPEQK